ncbi:His-Xaa-Ser system radical SAM maturase HxsC [Eubacteriales bacterium SGI.150]
MKGCFSNYCYGYRVVSIAKSPTVKEDLIHDSLDFLSVEEDAITLFPDALVLSRERDVIDCFSNANNYDVFEVWPDGRFHLYYDDSSIDNYFFVTGKCNSNCIMCPSPAAARKNSIDADITNLIEIARHIPAYTPHLTITGGEPFLAGKKIFPFFSFLKEKFETTSFLVLTNGRAFAIKEYAMSLKETAPNDCVIAIPLHGASSDLHDAITRSPNSFTQTVVGIKRLIELGLRVEIRVVVSRLNAAFFPSIVDFIIRELQGIEYVSVIAMEMTGDAYRNRDLVWIPYRQSFSMLASGIRKLISHGIDTKLYNFPLCTVERCFWPLCEKSISPEKVRYAPVCDSCEQKTACGGLFAGTVLLEMDELRAIL